MRASVCHHPGHSPAGALLEQGQIQAANGHPGDLEPGKAKGCPCWVRYSKDLCTHADRWQPLHSPPTKLCLETWALSKFNLNDLHEKDIYLFNIHFWLQLQLRAQHDCLATQRGRIKAERGPAPQSPTLCFAMAAVGTAQPGPPLSPSHREGQD